MYFQYLMAGIINGCIIDILLEDIMFNKTIWNAFCMGGIYM